MTASPLLGWLIDGTVCGSLAIVLVAVLAPLGRRWLGARASFWLWALVLLRLFVPGLTPAPIPWPGLDAPALPPPATERWTATARVTGDPPSPPIVTETPAPVPADRRPVFSPALAVTAWALGAGVLLGFAAVRSLRAGRLARRARDLSADPALAPLLDELAGPSRRFGARETAELRSPALCGLWRPVILLPLDWRERLTPADLRFVLLHEIGHFKRGDLFWRWAFFLARAVHWFNPLVWIAARLARSHQEMACDEWVVLRLGAPSAPAYGEALLTAARRIVPRALGFPVQAEMAESRAGLRRRLAHLVTARRRGWPAGFAAALVGLVGFGLTGAAPRETPEPPAAPSTAPTDFVSDPPKPTPEKTAAPHEGRTPLQVEIESKFVQVSPEAAAELFGSDAAGGTGVRAIYSREQFQEFLRKLDQKKGTDLMSAPRVTTRSGQRATIQIVREFRYPTQFDPPVASATLKIPATPSHFETRNLGVTLEVEPTVTNDHRIHLAVSPEVADFAGFIDYGGRREAKPDLARDAIAEAGRQITTADNVINQPVFSVRRMTTSLSLKNRQTVLIGVTNANNGPLLPPPADFEARSPAEPRAQGALFIFVTATLIDLEGLPFDRDAAAPAPAKKILPTPRLDPTRNLPYGTPVEGKPGFVTSPYAPQNGYVDLRGFSPNTEVKDPYSGKIFLAP